MPISVLKSWARAIVTDGPTPIEYHSAPALSCPRNSLMLSRNQTFNKNWHFGNFGVGFRAFGRPKRIKMDGKFTLIIISVSKQLDNLIMKKFTFYEEKHQN